MLLQALLLSGLSLSFGNTYNDTLFRNVRKQGLSTSPRSDLDFWLYQGDMWLNRAQTAMLDVPRRSTPQRVVGSVRAPAALANSTQLWDGGIIPYVFDCSLKNMPGIQRIVRQAMKEWEAKTCLQFVERDKEIDYITFFRGTHCFSSVGRTGEKAVSIGHNCEYSHVMLHELGHVIGFWHEQSRPDRDEHVKIVRKNIARGWEYAFLKLKEEAVNSMQVPYDYASIMHYPFNAFSKSHRRKTIVPLRPYKGRPYRRLSKLDVLQTNILYQCPGTSSESNSISARRRRDTDNNRLHTKSGNEERKCEDKMRSCAYWTSLGFCEKRRDLMLTKCMRSCTNCSSARKPRQEVVAIINPQTTPARPTPQSASCNDSSKACPHWASRGYCKTRPDVMHIHCRRSCDICSPELKDRCIDRNPRCKTWSNLMYCTNAKYKEMMKRVCRRSCGLCTAETSVCRDVYRRISCLDKKRAGNCESADPYTRLTMLKMCALTCNFCRRIRQTKRVVEPPCVDVLKACFAWSKLGFCRFRPRYMDEYCKKSCHVCSSRDPRYTDSKCLDNSITCPEWKKHNYCKTRKRFMEFNCKRTCNLCRRKEQAPAPCEDKNPTYCPMWAQKGECHARVMYMIRNCQKSCNICQSSETKKPVVQMPCYDTDKRQCPIWAQQGKCDTDAEYNKYCRLSCGVCFPEGSSDSSTCKNKDDDLSCKHWAGLGKCDTRPEYMIKNCQNACNACPKDPPTTIPASPKGIRCTPACKDWLQRGMCGRWRRCLRTCLAGGCDDEPVRPEGRCSSPMGLGWNSTLPDSAFNASSTLSKGKWDFGAHNARLYKEDDPANKRVGGWCAEKSTRDQWLQVDLGKIKIVTAIATQGRDKFFEHVKTFGLSYSKSGKYWTKYKEKGRVRILSGNCDHFTPVVTKLKKQVRARYVRIYPKTFQNICMRLEIYGCSLPQG